MDSNMKKGRDTPKLSDKEQYLKKIIKNCGSAVVAFSGGVDSSLLASIAGEVLGEKAVAVTAKSPTYPSWDAGDAKKVAQKIGVRHIFLETEEFDNPNFTKNPTNRCYYCKEELLEGLNRIRKGLGFEKILEGTNWNDRNDYRPGITAIKEFGEIVLSPLSEANLTKEDIRKLARERNLPVADKPSSPCLASRIPYGSPINYEKIERIEKAEKFLRSIGFRVVRVRDHDGLARIEVDKDKISKLVERSEDIINVLKNLGYKHVSIDLEGYRTGSLNPDREE